MLGQVACPNDASCIVAGPEGLTTMPGTILVDSEPPEADANPEEIRDWVNHQLDSIGSTPLLDQFVLLGEGERRRGGLLQLCDKNMRMLAVFRERLHTPRCMVCAVPYHQTWRTQVMHVMP